LERHTIDEVKSVGVKGWGDEVVPWTWITLDEISPGVIAIDVPNYLTRRLTVMKANRLPDGRIPLMHVGTFFSLVRASLSSHILPVFIFDGPPESRKRNPNPELVRHAADLYREFAHEGDPYNEEIAGALWKSRALRMYFAAEHLKALGSVVGVPSITAPSEAEMLGAAMCRDGVVDTVVSNDVDTLLFGSPHVTKQLQSSNSRILRATLSDLESHLGLVLEQLRDLAVLCGCDFHDGVKGIGPRKGVILLQRYGGLVEVLKAKGIAHSQREDFVRAREVFDEPNYLTTENYSFSLNPPIVPKLTRLLTPVLSEEATENLVMKSIKLWKGFGNHQSTLEQWL
jgi:flap endonuclease-1